MFYFNKFSETGQDWLGIADKVSRPSSILSADNWFRPSDTWRGVL
jgi:hypothetical protein